MKQLATLTLLLIVAGCSSPLAPSLPVEAYQADADAVAVLAYVGFRDTPEASPDNPDRNVGDECDNCHGTGRSGDGLGKCNVCGGDGKIDERDIRKVEPPAFPFDLPTKTVEIEVPTAPPPVSIVLHVSQADAAEWSVAWWKTEKSYFESLGAKVEYEQTDEAASWLEVCCRTCERIDGVPSRKRVLDTIEQVKK